MLGFAASEARASLVITLGDATVASGGTATIGIGITSNSADTLSGFNFELLITPVGSPPPTGLLSFADSQPNTVGNPNYVFFGQSGIGSNVFPPSTTNYADDTITGGDFAGAAAVVIPPGAGGPFSFLADVQFQPVFGMNGDTFQVSLVIDPNQTFFDDANGNALGFSSNVGQVMIATVPEPSSLTLAALSSLGGLVYFWRRRRQG